MLEVNDVSKRFGNRYGVQSIDFTMERGEIVGFLGPNGAGKTTTMRMITGYLNPTSGSIRLDGLAMSDAAAVVRRKIGYLPETPPLYPDMSVNSYLKFVADLRDVPAREQKVRIAEMIDKLDLHGRERQLIRNLSKGYKQRLGLAQAIIHKPELLVLDEPTSGLDPNQIVEIRQLIRELGEQHTVLLSTHILPEVNALCNRVLIIHQGRLVLDERPDRLGAALGQETALMMEVKGPEREVIELIRGLGEDIVIEQLAPIVPTLHERHDLEVINPEVRERVVIDVELGDGLKKVGHDELETIEEIEVERKAGVAASTAHTDANTGVAASTAHTDANTLTDTVKLKVISRNDQDVREPLFFALAQAGYPILELKRQSTSLEEVFTRLTTEEASRDAQI
ncbi:ABC transporter ATP-binding protein [Paenibacillus sp. 481]|uniref:ABC transporter ATP-binding protein n=1 Tax=Paenibacillus sp. 481 TaxID=2835869 RepID=UPI001E5FFB41|nr:ABC transporter ATP-binding protein [Paenibacillus sp. 481]UHA74480.1 ABC transporter ATP-binding protein [Paenibacillus sp. 481]